MGCPSHAALSHAALFTQAFALHTQPVAGPSHSLLTRGLTGAVIHQQAARTLVRARVDVNQGEVPRSLPAHVRVLLALRPQKPLVTLN